MNENIDISKIESAVFKVIEAAGVSKNIFVGRRPKSYEDMQDLVVIRVSGGAIDRTAIGTGGVSIEIYARTIGALRDSNRMTEMWGKVVNSVPGQHESYYLDLLNTTPSIEDSNGFDFEIINFTLVIKQ